MYKIYGKPNCTFCDQAKRLLNDSRISFDYIDVSENKEAYQWLVDMNFRSVPVIYEGDHLVGGFQQLQKHLLTSKQ